MVYNCLRSRSSSPAQRHPSMERLEDRLALAVRLTYEAGVELSLVEQAGGATPTVTISEITPGLIRINLGGETFDPQSTAQGSQDAPGLTYQSGAPESSNFATLNISAAFWMNQVTNNVPLRANLVGDALALGPITNAAGILGGINASAATINVNSLDTSLTNALNGNVDLRAAGALTMMGSAVLKTGEWSISLAAGVNDNGTASSTGGTL